jgi:hypothetical protein
MTSVQGESRWPSGLQFTFSLLGILLSWAVAFGTLAAAAIDIISGVSVPADQVLQFFTVGSSFFVGLVLLPSALLSFRNLSGKAVVFSDQIRKAALWIRKLFFLLFLPMIAVGVFASQNAATGWLLLPLTHIVTVATVVAALIWLATRKLKSGSGQRNWGALGSGLVLSPILAFVAEVIVGVFFFVVLAFYLAGQPGLMQSLEGLRESPALANGDVDALLPYISSLLADPFLVILVLAFVGVAVPMIEELLKPAAVWLLLGRKLSPKDGFVLGALSGAGFALFEYLTLGATVESWVLVFMARIGTTGLHMFATGLMGWAIVTAKNTKRYGLLVGSYLLSVTMHGLWNSMAVLGSFSALGQASGGSWLPVHLIFSSGSVLFLLTAGSIFGLWKSNQGLRLLDSESIEEPLKD